MKLAILLCVGVSSCGAGEPELPRSERPEEQAVWPAGTVLAINEVPILGAEVDELCRAIAELNPAWTQPHQRRLALTNVFLPRAAAHSRYDTAWEAARAACASQSEDIRGDGDPTAEVLSYSGTHSGLGLDLWGAARTLELGEWSAPLEVVGRWVLVRLDAADEARRDLEISVIVFRYVAGPEDEDPAPALAAAWAASTTTYVDPSWAEYIPKQWQFKQRGSKP